MGLIDNKDYYLLEIDDAVIALENKDAEINELRNLLKECEKLLFDNGFLFPERDRKKVIEILTEINKGIAS